MQEQIRTKIETNLKDLVEQRFKFLKLDTIHPFFYRNLTEYTLRPGKRVRPMLLTLAYKGYAPKFSESIYQAAASIELLHNFMLIHDDIIDCSDLRRGKPTLHKLLEKINGSDKNAKLGTDLGIIAGDMLYALAIEALLHVKTKPEYKERALEYFTQTTLYTAIGEFVDTIFGSEPLSKISKDKVFLNYTLKTARYTFEGPLIIGATLAGAPQKEIHLLSQLSILAGQAFQIQDDVIGIFGTEDIIGKSILSDLQESKKTLLVWHAQHHLKSTAKSRFISLFTKPHKTLHDLALVRKIFIEAGSLAYCLAETHSRIDQSLRLCKKLRMKPSCRDLITETIAKPFTISDAIAKENHIS